MGDQYLVRRGKKGKGGYAFRIAVPADVRGHFRSSAGTPLGHITIGLGTDSLSAARARRDKMLAEWRLNFERARGGLDLSLPEIEEQAREIYLSRLEHMEDLAKRGLAPQGLVEEAEDGNDGPSEEREIAALEIALAQYAEAFEADDFSIELGGDESGRHSLVAGQMGTVQRRTKVTLDLGSETYRIMARAILEANMAAISGRIKMLRGQSSEAPVTFLGSKGIDPVSLRPIARQKPAIRKDGLRFSEAAALFLAEQQRDPSAALRGSTFYWYDKVCKIFAESENDPLLDAVTRKMAADYLHKVGEERKLSNRTLRQYAIILAMVFKWARKSGRFEGENPFSEQSFKEPKDRGYLPYSDVELKTLFTGPLFSKPFSDPLAWISLIALYSGMRLNEIAQLKVSDLKEERGIWIFEIQEGDGQKLKTRAATRKVPIHSELIKAGLLQYNRSQPKQGQLFPTLSPAGPDKKFGRNLSRKFTEYRRKLKITRARLSFHSLRKNFGTALDRAGIPPSDREALLGHSRGFSLDVYSTGPGLKRLQEMVEAVTYPSLHDGLPMTAAAELEKAQ